MDTSKEYILMSKKAEEIQKLWKPNAGDWITFPKVMDKNKEHPCTCLSEFIEIVKDKQYQVLCYWRCYMLADDNAPNILLKEKGYLASNWKTHIFELENSILWLPRQDQLQEIIQKDFHSIWDMLWDLSYTIGEQENSSGIEPYFGKFNSMEKIWLGFVMYTKYKKIWNDAKGHEMWVEDFREGK